MKSSDLTDEQVELEIERLKQSPLVRLAQKEQRLKNAQKNAQRQRLYTLRWQEKRGRQLMNSGVTFEKLEELSRQLRADYDPLEDTDGEDWF